MSNNVNSGVRVKEEAQGMAVRAINKHDTTKRIRGKGLEKASESNPINGTQSDASNLSIITSVLTSNSSTDAHIPHKGSHGNEMDPESPAITRARIEHLRSYEPARRPASVEMLQPTTGSILPGVGGTIPTKPSQKRKNDESTPSDSPSDLPDSKKSRLDREDEVKQHTKPARKVYRGIGSGDGTVVYDRSSYSLPTLSVEQQAREESDFVGEADYYDIRYEELQETAFPGTYLIVYSRLVDGDEQTYGKFETYRPNFKDNKIVIASTGAVTPVAGGRGLPVKYSGVWAEGELDFNGCSCTFAVESRYSRDATRAACSVKVELARLYPGSSALDQVLQWRPRNTGSSISKVGFGLKYMRSIVDDPGTRENHLGFKFIAMDLATWDPTSGEECTLRVVAIKIPKKREVASAFLLNQQLVWPDLKHLIRKSGLRAAPTIALRDLQRNKEGAGSSSTKQKSWAEKAEAAADLIVKKKTRESMNSGDSKMV